MELAFFTEIFDVLRDPFYCFGIIAFCFVMFFIRHLTKNETEIGEQLKHDDTTITLSNVSTTFSAKSVSFDYGWFKTNVIFTPNSIFVFGGGGKTFLHNQYYLRHKPPPKKLVSLEKDFIPIDEIKLDGDNLIIRYISPHWHEAKCTLTLKNIMEKDDSEPIRDILINDFGL